MTRGRSVEILGIPGIFLIVPKQHLDYRNIYTHYKYQESSMTRSTVFYNNKTQAVRLPKAVALPETVKRVEIIKQGCGLPARAKTGSRVKFRKLGNHIITDSFHSNQPLTG
jgi:virulence-associated protein VagC